MNQNSGDSNAPSLGGLGFPSRLGRPSISSLGSTAAPMHGRKGSHDSVITNRYAFCSKL